MDYLKQVRHIPRRLIVLGIALLILVVVLQQTVNFSFADFERTVDDAGIFGPLVFTFVLFLGLTIPFNPVSDLATVNVAALLFEPEVSIAGTVAAQSASLVVNYWFARHFGDRTLRLLSGERAAAFVAHLTQTPRINGRTFAWENGADPPDTQSAPNQQ